MFTHRVNESTELRLYQPHHADEVFAATEANREHIRQWLPWVDAVKSVDDTRDFIRKGLEQYSGDNGFQAGIWEDNLYVGGVGFHWINRSNQFTEIGYWLVKSAQGRGIMSAACAAAVDHAFDVWKLNKVEIRAASTNHRSRAIPKRLGFMEEATIRQVNKIGSEYHDLVVYGMLTSEWMARRAAMGRPKG